MAKELYVSSTPHETKVAVVEEDQLSEIYFERENEYTLAGSIYKGRVTRVLPGMQSAFVNIGLERDAFLYVSDFLMEEDEDSDAIGEAVASSRNSPIIEVRSPQGQDGPIEAQEIMPPITVGDEEPEDAEQESAEGASEEKSAPQEQEREGARKWRGRRRRGRGGRDRFNDRGAQEQAGDRSEQQEKPVEAAQEEQSESRPEPSPEPRYERQESRPEGRSEGRHQGRSEYRRENRQDRYESRSEQNVEHPEPILLPGESISKYQPHGSQSSTAATQTPVKTESAPRPRPSTEYSIDPSAFSAGSMVLPGETLAKYGKDKQQAHGKSGAQPENLASEHVAEHATEQHEHGFLQDAESAGPIPAKFEEEERTEARVEAPRVFHRRETAPAIEEPEVPSAFEEPQKHTADADEQRFERMNVASVFGGGAAEVEETEVDEDEQAEEATHLDSSLEPPAQEHESWTPQGNSENFSEQNRGAQARGVIEEEEIEEEESDLPRFEEDLDMGEFEELEEEVLGQSGEQMVPMGKELMEAVRDAHVNEQATGKYEAEGLDPDELEEVEEAFGHGEEDAESGDVEIEEATQEDLEDGSAEQGVAAASGHQQRTDRKPHDRRGGRRGSGRRPMRGRPRHQSARQMPAISDLLKEGQEILVQIAKEPIAKKGARITSHIALPGRYLVYMPTVHHTGVSRKIASEEERHRLKRIALSERGDAQGGFIVRTAAAGAEEQDLRNDIRFLINLWNEIRGRADTSKAPALIYHDLNLVERILRDQVSGSFSAIWADTEQEYERILRFVSRFQPSLVKRVKLYSKDTPLFEQFNITEEINKALKSKVWLRSGGYIVINQTEALVAIDINTGKYVGKTARLEDTIVKTNIDAIKEIVRQIRLRDLGGIIVIDFIDMDERRNRAK